MDFGLAKHEAGHEMTGSGQFVGTPLFMAPEQVLGQPVDGRTDLFSLGSVAYTLLTGVRPFAADSVPRIMARVAHQEPPPPSTVVPELPTVLDYLVARAMAKSPADRYPTGAAMAEDVEDILAGRAPRHQGGWTASARAEGTLVAARKGEESSVLELELEPVAEPQAQRAASPGEPAPSPAPAARSRRVSPLRTLTLGMLLAGLVALYLSINLPPPLREAARVAPPLPPFTPSSLAASSPPPLAFAPLPAAHQEPGAPAGGKAPVVAAPVEPTPQPPTPAPSSAAEAPEPESGPEAPAADISQPTPAPPPVRKAPPAAAKPMGQLAIHMEHHLKSGKVRVFLDGKLLLQDDLDARVSRKILFFSLRKGLVQEVLNVSPGRHELRVEVRWDDNAETKRITGTFKPGVTRHLEIGVSRIGGNLSLEWR
jgi:serine/threonine-protein kinase